MFVLVCGAAKAEEVDDQRPPNRGGLTPHCAGSENPQRLWSLIRAEMQQPNNLKSLYSDTVVVRWLPACTAALSALAQAKPLAYLALTANLAWRLARRGRGHRISTPPSVVSLLCVRRWQLCWGGGAAVAGVHLRCGDSAFSLGYCFRGSGRVGLGFRVDRGWLEVRRV